MKIEEEEELLKNLKSKVQKIDDNMMNDCHTKID